MPESVARRVCFVASYAPSLLNFRGELIKSIIARGHHMICAAPAFDAKTRSGLEALGAECHAVPLERTGLNPLADLKSLARLVKFLRQVKPDVAMGYTPKPAIYTAIAARLAGVDHNVPLITGLGFAFAGGDGLKGRLLPVISKTLYRLALHGADGVIFQNQDDQAFFQRSGLIPGRVVIHRVKGSGVDLSHFDPAPLPDLSGKIRLLMIARLVGYKGILEYAKAAELVRQQYDNVEFILAGPEDDSPSALTPDELAFVKSRVNYIGAISDVRGEIARAHIYVLPSYGEGMPRTVLEALAIGRPIITTAVNGCRETVIEGENGLLVPARDHEALAAAMAQCVSAPARLAAMGEASLALARRDFDVHRVNEGMLAALKL